MKYDYISNPARYQYAPRTQQDAFKDVDYSTAIHHYEEDVRFPVWILAIFLFALLGVAVYYF